MSGGNWKEMYLAACEGDLDLVAFHVQQGVDVNYAHPEFLSTPLVACLLAGQEAVALYLLDHGADPHLHSESDGMAPAQAARSAGMARVQARLAALGAGQREPEAAVPAKHATHRPALRFVVPSVLLLVAAIHALPVMGVIGATKLSQLYGVPIQDANLELLLRHRAVLFGLLAAFLAFAALRPALHRLALVAGLVSVVSFLLLAQPASALNAAVVNVVRADWVALALLVVGTAVHVVHRARTAELAFGPGVGTWRIGMVDNPTGKTLSRPSLRAPKD
jgi:hypothetical protein